VAFGQNLFLLNVDKITSFIGKYMTIPRAKKYISPVKVVPKYGANQLKVVPMVPP
jgi:hypothetical protein